jgi:hypothetical protein
VHRRVTANYKLGKMWKETVVTYLKALSQNLSYELRKRRNTPARIPGPQAENQTHHKRGASDYILLCDDIVNQYLNTFLHRQYGNS